MKTFAKIISSKIAKSKKAIGGIIAGVIAAVIGFSILTEGGIIIGTVIGAAILVAITAGVYFWLKAIDELPDSF